MTKYKWLGSVLNFLVPGLGNIYARNIAKGILTYVLYFIVVYSLRFVAYNFVLFVVSLSLIASFFLYLIISGYRDVKRNNRYEQVWFDKWYFYILVLVSHWAFISTIKGKTLDSLTPINFASIPTPTMDPGLRIGDVLALKRTKKIERNDVVIFWFPDGVETMYVKRCIGLPGDSLKISNTTVVINGAPQTGPSLKFKYIVKTEGSEINLKALEKLQISESDFYSVSPEIYQFFLTQEQVKRLRGLPFIKKIDISVATEGEPETMIYPKSEAFNWNSDFYGPIYIPRKGDKIELTDETIDLYLKCIAFENESAEMSDSGLMVNGKLVSTYEFKQDYFFMMGDNRHNSLDSRYWGLLPPELVIGKAMYLYWGQTPDRIGKKVL